MVHLPDEASEVFALFVDWIYRDEIPYNNNEEHFYNLFKLYIFAEKIVLKELADTTIDQIQGLCMDHEEWKSPLSPELTNYVYSKTRIGSPLRELCIHELAFGLFESSEGSSEEPLPALDRIEDIRRICKGRSDFLVDYLVYLKKNYKNGLPNPSAIRQCNGGCFYHAHDQDNQEIPCSLSDCDEEEWEEWEEWEELSSDEAKRNLLRNESSRDD